jgi:hypothetical protein
MKSFFSRFKDNLKMDFGGRYFGAILTEVLNEDLSILKILFPTIDTKLIKNKKYTEIGVEKVFPSEDAEYRLADLVVKYKGKYRALLEIKYEKDQPQPGQLEDYMAYSDENELCFTYLTQYYPKEGDLKKITEGDNDKYTHLLFSTFYKKLLKKQKDKNPMTKLFCNFLEENVMIYDNSAINDNEDVLLLLLIKGLHVRENTGFGKKVSKANINGIPVLWDKLIGNVTVLGDKFYNDFDKYFNNRFSVDFGFNPNFNLRLLNRDIVKREDSGYLQRSRKIGGYFFITANGKIKQKKSDDWLQVCLGFYFNLDLVKKTLLKYLYVEVNGKGHINTENEKKVTKLPKEAECYTSLLKLTKETINEALMDCSEMRGSFKKSLGGLEKEIQGKL